MRSTATELLDVIVRNKLGDLNLKGRIEDMEQVPALGASCDIFVGHLQAGDRRVKVAVKKLRIFCNKEAVVVKRLAKEVYIWSRLKHKNVLPLLGFFLDETVPFPHLVSEWMARGTLFDYLRILGQGMDTIKMAEGIASGLSYLHKNDVVHADLKSPNILISDSGKPLIADFGVSHVLSATMTAMCGTTAVSSKGTVRWTAIELFATGELELITIPDKRSDVWAFGMVLYELLTRKLPYDNLRFDHQIITAIASGQLPKPPSPRVSIGSRRLWNICQRCWTTNPQDRPTMHQIHRDIEAAFPRVLEDKNAARLAIQKLRRSRLEMRSIKDRTKSFSVVSSPGSQHYGRIFLNDSNDNSDPAPFPPALAPLALAKLVRSKSMGDLKGMGGISGLMKGLSVRPGWGIDVVLDSRKMIMLERGIVCNRGKLGFDGKPFRPILLADRHRVYGRNVLGSRASKTILRLMWQAFKDKMLSLLSIAALALVALATFLGPKRLRSNGRLGCEGFKKCPDTVVDWAEGLVIVNAILVVLGIGSFNDWQKERQLKVLDDQKVDQKVKAIRGGSQWAIRVKDIVVGDILLLEPGDVVPCDGIFLQGHNVSCDEGGCIPSKKLPYASVDHALRTGSLLEHTDCFVISGSKVLEGGGSYLVLTVGARSMYGEIMAALVHPKENSSQTPLMKKLYGVSDLISKYGNPALLLFVVALVRSFVYLWTNAGWT